ncbi:MAG: hypothetical protein JSS76_16065 [Bacteroidetes bacterium]|nr:hypothetical protein [Bacteroidota bacterium]
MKLIASTVAYKNGIKGIIVAVTDEEYNYYMANTDFINENTVSATFLKEYIEQKGIPFTIALERFEKAYAGRIGIWSNAYTVSIPLVKEILDSVDETLNFHEFIDAYCAHLKNL